MGCARRAVPGGLSQVGCHLPAATPLRPAAPGCALQRPGSAPSLGAARAPHEGQGQGQGSGSGSGCPARLWEPLRTWRQRSRLGGRRPLLGHGEERSPWLLQEVKRWPLLSASVARVRWKVCIGLLTGWKGEVIPQQCAKLHRCKTWASDKRINLFLLFFFKSFHS